MLKGRKRGGEKNLSCSFHTRIYTAEFFYMTIFIINATKKAHTVSSITAGTGRKIWYSVYDRIEEAKCAKSVYSADDN
jgi:hypothetical protein